MTSEQLYLIDQKQMEINFEWLPPLLLLKINVLFMLKDPYNEQIVAHKKLMFFALSV